jgi:hypothetical protein
VKFLSLTTYLGFVWALFVSLCLAPGESFGQTATQYSRVVAQAERIAYLAAQRSALRVPGGDGCACTLRELLRYSISCRSGRLGGARCRRGISPGADVLFATDLAAIKTASSTPGGWQVAEYQCWHPDLSGARHQQPRPMRTIPTRPFSSARPMSRCARSIPSISMIGSSGPFRVSARRSFLPATSFVNGPAVGGQSLYVCHRKGIPGSPAPLQDALIPPTPQQAANYLTGLPTSDPKSIEAHTNPVGTTGSDAAGG